MTNRDLSRGAKSLWQRIEAYMRSMLPRQAHVTRTEGSTVWVRFVGESVDSPESQFPSTVIGIPVGTVGWVATLGGKKGLFHATAIMMPQSLGNFGAAGIGTIGSSGTFPIPTRSVTFSGLIPGREYTIDASVSVSGSGGGRLRVHPVAIGDTTYQPNSPSWADFGSNIFPASYHYVLIAKPDADGELVVQPAVTWISGSTAVSNASIRATVR